MLTGLLFGIIVPMYLSYPDNAQDILDRGNGIYVGSTGCHNTKLIAAHNYRKLGKKILKIKVGEVVEILGCKYKVEDKITLPLGASGDNIKTGYTWLQTCKPKSKQIYLYRLKF